MSLLSGSGVGDCRTQQQLVEMNRGLRVPRVWDEGARGGVQGMQSMWRHARHDKGVVAVAACARRQSPPRSPPAGDIHHDCRVIVVAGCADIAGFRLSAVSPQGGSRPPWRTARLPGSRFGGVGRARCWSGPVSVSE